MRVVLDASAVLAYLQGENGAARVERIVGDTSQSVSMHSINLIEVHYRFTAFGGEMAANAALADLERLGVKNCKDISTTLFSRICFYKSRYQFLSLADSVCIALGEQLKATVITCDKPFANVKEGVKIELIR